MSNRKLITASVSKFKEALRSSDRDSNGATLSLGQRQHRSRIDHGPPSSLWTSQITVSAPLEHDARDAIIAATKALGDNGESSLSLHTSSVNAEWVAAKTDPKARVKDTPKDRYEALMGDVTKQGTIILVHGGAFFTNGLGTSRPTAAKLAKETGYRVLVLDYRLAPQSAFPSQILDLFILYLSLLSPPPGSYHRPIPASSIVIAAESAGACISLSFLQVLLQIQQQNQQIRFHGRTVDIRNPAGILMVSCVGEQSLALPSWTTNKEYDIFRDQAPFLQPEFPADEIWPSDPPRADVYCDASMLPHPLVSPSLCENWHGAPPMWFAVGQERLADSSMLIAQTAARQGVCVMWNQYEAMPHCWPLFLPKLPHSQHVLRKWGQACRAMIEGGKLVTKGSWISLEDLGSIDVDVRNLTRLTVDEASTMIKGRAEGLSPYIGMRKGISRL
ncbi:MAG: hypothetical protein Q9227_009273 [Pyrenula ochraceoflavens]